MKIRYHLDESVTLLILKPLRMRGIDTTTPADANLLGAADEEHLGFASDKRRVLVAHDADYLRLHNDGNEHAGIAYCHQSKYLVGDLVRVLILLHSCYTAEEMHNRIEFI